MKFPIDLFCEYFISFHEYFMISKFCVFDFVTSHKNLKNWAIQKYLYGYDKGVIMTILWITFSQGVHMVLFEDTV